MLRALGQQLGHMVLVIGIDGAKALRFAAEACLAMQQRVVIDLIEGFQRHAELLAVTQHRLVVVRNAPRPWVEIQALVEPAMLRGTAQLGIAVAAAQRPVPSVGAVVVFKQLHAVAGLAQLEGGAHAGQPGTENQDRRPLGVAIQLQRAFEIGFGRHAQAAHRLIHHRAAGGHTDARQQLPPRHRSRVIALHQRTSPACRGRTRAAGNLAGHGCTSECVGQIGEQLARCDQLVRA